MSSDFDEKIIKGQGKISTACYTY